MKLSEELIYRGFTAETTIKNPEDLDTRESKKFYWGADPSADSLTIGNLFRRPCSSRKRLMISALAARSANTFQGQQCLLLTR